ncbi:MAG: carbohydrate kinase, partial [Oscillospiraceae bacterium]
DSFYAGFLTKFLESGKEIGDIKMADLREFADFANACGSVCSTKIGGISSMPTREEVENCIKNIKKI